MVAKRTHSRVHTMDRGIVWLARRWLLAVNLAMGLFIGGTLLPPVFLRFGLEGPARIVYSLYSFTCHQLPQRSYFLFGPHGVDTYSEAQVIAWGAEPDHLRRFVGNDRVGFKLGMAQRNTAIYTAFFLTGLAYGLVRKRLPRLHWPLFLLLILPMALDGGSHVASEITGLGFRETNAWLVALSGGVFPNAFYTGTTLGSFNWLMRTLTGMLFAVACIWFTYPYLEQGFADMGHQAERKLRRTPVPATRVSLSADQRGG